ncbi:MAG: hypothetical protein LBH13_03990 [Cellulomonadaceae bacterium]|jgi:hypothetical protein|nr:hypothetical protein [Cellulomonadaceae bacterium]
MALKHSSHHNPSYDLLPHQVVVLLRDCVLLDAFNHALANSRWRTESGQSSTQSLMDKIARKIRQNDAHVASLLSGASSGDPCPRSPEEPLPTVQLKLMVEQLSIIALFDEILSSNSNEISENTYTMSLSAARKRIEEIDQELLTLMANQ